MKLDGIKEDISFNPKLQSKLDASELPEVILSEHERKALVRQFEEKLSKIASKLESKYPQLNYDKSRRQLKFNLKDLVVMTISKRLLLAKERYIKTIKSNDFDYCSNGADFDFTMKIFAELMIKHQKENPVPDLFKQYPALFKSENFYLHAFGEYLVPSSALKGFFHPNPSDFANAEHIQDRAIEGGRTTDNVQYFGLTKSQVDFIFNGSPTQKINNCIGGIYPRFVDEKLAFVDHSGLKRRPVVVSPRFREKVNYQTYNVYRDFDESTDVDIMYEHIDVDFIICSLGADDKVYFARVSRKLFYAEPNKFRYKSFSEEEITSHIHNNVESYAMWIGLDFREDDLEYYLPRPIQNSSVTLRDVKLEQDRCLNFFKAIIETADEQMRCIKEFEEDNGQIKKTLKKQYNLKSDTRFHPLNQFLPGKTHLNADDCLQINRLFEGKQSELIVNSLEQITRKLANLYNSGGAFKFQTAVMSQLLDEELQVDDTANFEFYYDQATGFDGLSNFKNLKTYYNGKWLILNSGIGLLRKSFQQNEWMTRALQGYYLTYNGDNKKIYLTKIKNIYASKLGKYASLDLVDYQSQNSDYSETELRMFRSRDIFSKTQEILLSESSDRLELSGESKTQDEANFTVPVIEEQLEFNASVVSYFSNLVAPAYSAVETNIQLGEKTVKYIELLHNNAIGSDVRHAKIKSLSIEISKERIEMLKSCLLVNYLIKRLTDLEIDFAEN